MSNLGPELHITLPQATYEKVQQFVGDKGFTVEEAIVYLVQQAADGKRIENWLATPEMAGGLRARSGT